MIIEQILDETLVLSPDAYKNKAAATIEMKVKRTMFQQPDISHQKEKKFSPLTIQLIDITILQVKLFHFEVRMPN